MFFRGVKPSTRFCWHYETGQFRVLQRPSAAFSPVLTHQLSKSHLTAQRGREPIDQNLPGVTGRGGAPARAKAHYADDEPQNHYGAENAAIGQKPGYQARAAVAAPANPEPKSRAQRGHRAVICRGSLLI